MTRPLLIALALAGGIALTSEAQTRLPADFTMPKADSSPGTVTFSHRAHVLVVGKCTRCHMKDFKMTRGQSGPITLDAKLNGKFCGFCHDGQQTVSGRTIFPIDECERCHR